MRELKDNLKEVDRGEYECSSAHCKSQFDDLSFTSRTLSHELFGCSLLDAWYTDHYGKEKETGSTETIWRNDPINGRRFTSESLDDLLYTLTPRIKESKGALDRLKNEMNESERKASQR